MPKKKTNYQKKGFVRQLGTIFGPITSSSSSSKSGNAQEGGGGGGGSKWRPRQSKFERLDGDDHELISLSRAPSIESDVIDYRRENIFEKQKIEFKQKQARKRDATRITLKPSTRDSSKTRSVSRPKKRPEEEEEEEADTTTLNDPFADSPFNFDTVDGGGSVDSRRTSGSSRQTTSTKKSTGLTVSSDPAGLFSQEQHALTKNNLEKMAAMSAEASNNDGGDEIENVNPRSKFYQFTIDEDKESTVILPVGHPDEKTVATGSDDATERSFDVTSRGTRISTPTKDKGHKVQDDGFQDFFANRTSQENEQQLNFFADAGPTNTTTSNDNPTDFFADFGGSTIIDRKVETIAPPDALQGLDSSRDDPFKTSFVRRPSAHSLTYSPSPSANRKRASPEADGNAWQTGNLFRTPSPKKKLPGQHQQRQQQAQTQPRPRDHRLPLSPLNVIKPPNSASKVSLMKKMEESKSLAPFRQPNSAGKPDPDGWSDFDRSHYDENVAPVIRAEVAATTAPPAHSNNNQDASTNVISTDGEEPTSNDPTGFPILTNEAEIFKVMHPPFSASNEMAGSMAAAAAGADAFGTSSNGDDDDDYDQFAINPSDTFDQTVDSFSSSGIGARPMPESQQDFESRFAQPQNDFFRSPAKLFGEDTEGFPASTTAPNQESVLMSAVSETQLQRKPSLEFEPRIEDDQDEFFTSPTKSFVGGEQPKRYGVTSSPPGKDAANISEAIAETHKMRQSPLDFEPRMSASDDFFQSPAKIRENQISEHTSSSLALGSASRSSLDFEPRVEGRDDFFQSPQKLFGESAHGTPSKVSVTVKPSVNNSYDDSLTFASTEGDVDFTVDDEEEEVVVVDPVAPKMQEKRIEGMSTMTFNSADDVRSTKRVVESVSSAPPEKDEGEEVPAPAPTVGADPPAALPDLHPVVLRKTTPTKQKQQQPQRDSNSPASKIHEKVSTTEVKKNVDKKNAGQSVEKVKTTSNKFGAARAGGSELRFNSSSNRSVSSSGTHKNAVKKSPKSQEASKRFQQLRSRWAEKTGSMASDVRSSMDTKSIAESIRSRIPKIQQQQRESSSYQRHENDHDSDDSDDDYTAAEGDDVSTALMVESYSASRWGSYSSSKKRRTSDNMRIGIKSFPAAYKKTISSGASVGTRNTASTASMSSLRTPGLRSHGRLRSHVGEHDDDDDNYSMMSYSRQSSTASYCKPLGLPNNAIMASMLFRRHHHIDKRAVEAKIKAKEEENSKLDSNRGDIPQAIHAFDETSCVSNFSDDTAMLDAWKKPSRDLLDHFHTQRKNQLDMKAQLGGQQAKASTALFEA